MSVLVVFAALLVAAALVALIAGRGGARPGDYDQLERMHMPPELAGARLVLSQKTLYADGPVALCARPDQVFQTSAGVAIVVETKNRYRAEVYDFDVIELSVQAVVLTRGNDHRYRLGNVAPYGYVRIVADQRTPRYLRVALLDEQAVTAYYHRYVALRARRVEPVAPRDQRVCRNCGQRTRCPAMRA